MRRNLAITKEGTLSPLRATVERIAGRCANELSDRLHRSIDVRIARIRRKIEVDPEKPQILKTVRGAGYIFVSRPK